MGTSEATAKLRLSEVGLKLLKPPTLVKELLVLLDRVEVSLSLVEQSPSKEIQKALKPTLKALVSNELLRHSDVDVRVTVAACISEITRITAPEVPYNDDQMKEAFQLIVSSFEGLDDNTSQSYSKRTSILETFARVRLCVVMLDLEFDGMILEMFHHFIKTIRDYHPETVFACMENIMIRVIEESELISSDLLFCIMEAVRKDNKEVSPVACKLMTKVIGTCAYKLRPYVNMAVITKGVSLADYGDVVSQLHDEISAETDIQTEDSSASAVDTINARKSSEPMADTVSTAEKIPVSVVNSTENICTVDLLIRNGNPADPSYAVRNLDVPAGAKTDMIASVTVNEDPLTTAGNMEAKEDERKSKTEPVAETINKMQGRKTKAKNCKKTTCEAKLDGNASSDVKQLNVFAKDVSTSPRQISSNDVAGIKLSGETKDSANNFSQCSPSKTVVHSLKNHTSGNNKNASADCNLEEETINPTVDAREVEANLSRDDVPDGETNCLDAENLEGTSNFSGDAVPESIPPMVLEEEQSRIEKSTDNLGAQSDDSDKVENGRPKAKYDIKRRGKGLGKATLQNHAVTVENDNKKSNSTQKSVMKVVNHEKALKGTPKTTTKRKQIEESGSEDFGEELVGSKVKVWWSDDKRYYEGVIESFSSAKKKHKVLYSDGEVEHLVLKKERWEVINPAEVEDSPPKSKEGIKMRGRGLCKAIPQKHAVPSENNNKKSATTQKSVAFEKDLKGTLKTVSKRKRIEENKSGNKDFGEELVGSKVKVLWPDDKRYYKGVVQSFNPAKKTHKVLYSDGDVEKLLLKNEQWEIINLNEESDTVDDEEESDQETPDLATGKQVEVLNGGSYRKSLDRAMSSKSRSASASKAKTSSFKVEVKSKEEKVNSTAKLRADVHSSSVARSSSNRRKSDSKNAGHPPTIETGSVKNKYIEEKRTRSGDKNPSMKSAVKSKTKFKSPNVTPKSKALKMLDSESSNSEDASAEEPPSRARETRSSKRKADKVESESGQKKKKRRRH